MKFPHLFRRSGHVLGGVSLIFYFVLIISPRLESRAEGIAAPESQAILEGEAVEVVHGSAVAIELTPNSGELTADEFVALHVLARDWRGITWDATTEAVFLENDQAGFVKDAVYFAGTVGTTTLNASVDGVSDTEVSTFTVTAGVAARIDVTPGYTELTAGGTVDLVAAVKDADGNAVASQSVEWSSDVSAIASIDTAGHVSAKKLGLATLTAKQGTLTGTALVAVATPAKASKITMVPGDITISTDTPMTYTVVAYDAYDNAFERSDATAFSISGQGGVFTKNVLDPRRVGGPYTVTATYQEFSVTASVTIVGGIVASIATYPPTVELIVGERLDVNVDLLDADGNLVERATTWTVDDATVASVDVQGVVTAQTAGQTNVHIQSEGVEVTVPVRVSEPADEEQGEIVELQLEPDSLILTIDDEQSFTVVAVDEDGTEWDVTDEADFSTDDPTGEFDGNVYVPGSIGQWTIAASLEGEEDRMSVLVQHGAAVRISLTPDSVTMPIGRRTEFVVVGTDRRENTWDATREALFTSTGGGTFAGNTFTANTAGAFVVRASVDGATDSAPLAVTGVAPLVSPQPVTPAPATPAPTPTPTPTATPTPLAPSTVTPAEETVLGETTTTEQKPAEESVSTNAASNQTINTATTNAPGVANQNQNRNVEVLGVNDEEARRISPWWNLLWLVLIIPVAYYIIRGRDEKWS